MVVIKILRIAFYSIALSVVSHVSAAEAVKVAVNIMPSILESGQNTLPYNQFLNRLSQELNQKIELIYLPPARAGKVYDDYQTDCIFPASKKYIVEVPPPIASEPINYAKAYFFSQDLYTNEELINKPHFRIGVRRGFSYGSVLEKISKQKLVTVNNDEQSIGLLLKNRIDSFIAYVPDMNEQLRKPENSVIGFNESSPLYVQEESIVCHQTEQNKQFIATLNAVIQSLRASGQLAKLLGEYYVAP